jgi:hypothetical protein
MKNSFAKITLGASVLAVAGMFIAPSVACFFARDDVTERVAASKKKFPKKKTSDTTTTTDTSTDTPTKKHDPKGKKKK